MPSRKAIELAREVAKSDRIYAAARTLDLYDCDVADVRKTDSVHFFKGEPAFVGSKPIAPTKAPPKPAGPLSNENPFAYLLDATFDGWQQDSLEMQVLGQLFERCSESWQQDYETEDTDDWCVAEFYNYVMGLIAKYTYPTPCDSPIYRLASRYLLERGNPVCP